MFCAGGYQFKVLSSRFTVTASFIVTNHALGINARQAKRYGIVTSRTPWSNEAKQY